jgi:predicted glycosyltransferase
MRFMFDVAHPGQVHFTRNIVKSLQERGHDVLVTVWDKDIAIKLLQSYDINHLAIGRKGDSMNGVFMEWIKRDIDIYQAARKFKPDILFGMINPCITHAATLLGKTAICITDTDLTNFVYRAYTYWPTLPLCDLVCTPSNFRLDLGHKQLRFDGYKELAYLHPNQFKPDPAVLENIGLSKNDKFVVMRFVAWKALHDAGQKGFDKELRLRLVKEIEKKAQVIITSEFNLEKELEPYQARIPPARMHDLMYYAQALIGDSQTMTTEAGILGTPAIRCNSFVGSNDMSNFVELEKKYHLVYSLESPEDALRLSLELLERDGLKNEWAAKRAQLLKEKIDVTAFMVWLLENYPDSVEAIRNDPGWGQRWRG